MRRFIYTYPTIVPLPTLTFDLLLVAAGGAGGSGTTTTRSCAGGGGAGELIYLTGLTFSGLSYNITIGSGTTGNGEDSLFDTLYTASGGGKGGNYQQAGNGSIGGSGGGGAGWAATPPAGTSGGTDKTIGYGNDGGNGVQSGARPAGGGGGGAGQRGFDGLFYTSGSCCSATFCNVAGDGGDGLEININGTPTYYAGGGAGDWWEYDSCNPNGTGGLGGGGNARNPGQANTGGGGGAGTTTSNKLGGSGVCIIRYNSPTQLFYGGTVTTISSKGVGYYIHTFTSSGTFNSGEMSVTSGLIFNFDGIDYDNNGSYWNDISGNDNKAWPVASTNFDTDHWNITGGDDKFIVTGSTLTQWLTGGTLGTYVVIMYLSGTRTDNQYICSANSNEYNGWSNNYHYYSNYGVNETTGYRNNNVTATQRISGNTYMLEIDMPVHSYGGWTGLRIMGFTGDYYCSVGRIYASLLYNRTLTAQDRLQNLAYFKNKYGF